MAVSGVLPRAESVGASVVLCGVGGAHELGAAGPWLAPQPGVYAGLVLKTTWNPESSTRRTGLCVSGSLVFPSLRRCTGSEGSRREDLHSRPRGGVGLQRVLQELEVDVSVSQAGPFKWAQQDASVEMVPPNAGLRPAGPERLQRAVFLLF